MVTNDVTVTSPLGTARARGRIRGRLILLGPAFVAAVAYVDPGNFVTNSTAGARYGYLLVWVVVAANLAAMLVQTLGAASALGFAVALLLSGLASTSVGTYAGEIIMQGFLRRRVPLPVRRLVTLLPALVVLAAGVDPTRALVLSQVVLSFGIPFALIPVVAFTRRRDLMGDLVNRRLTTAVAVVITALVVALNGFLLWQVAG